MTLQKIGQWIVIITVGLVAILTIFQAYTMGQKSICDDMEYYYDNINPIRACGTDVKTQISDFLKETN